MNEGKEPGITGEQNDINETRGSEAVHKAHGARNKQNKTASEKKVNLSSHRWTDEEQKLSFKPENITEQETKGKKPNTRITIANS